jgi:hypothetical protein
MPITKAEAVVRGLKKSLTSSDNAILRRMKIAMGNELIKCIMEAYKVKSKGGVDLAGIKWKPTKAFLAGKRPILINKRKLINGFDVELTDKGFKIVNRVEYSVYAFARRKPWPADNRRFPEEWSKRLLKVAKPYLERLTREAFTKYAEKYNSRPIITWKNK